MVYVISDIHGEYEKYRKMLDLISFLPDDTLYVLGDVVDRGPEPVKVLKDMAARDNVYPILGNHDALAIDLLRHLMVEISEENYRSHLDEAMLSHLADWQMDGGMTTLRGFQKLSREEQYDLIDYMEEFARYEVVSVGERTFVLVHAGLENFSPGRKLSSYQPGELIFCRHDYNRRYFPDPSIYIVTGHTPTMAITGQAKIHVCENNIAMDCGATYPGGRLACLCLDTMEEYYV